MKIITKRPEGMDFGEYKRVRAEQNRNIRAYLKCGTVCHMSWQRRYHKDPFTGQDLDISHIEKFKPFRGNVRKDFKHVERKLYKS